MSQPVMRVRLRRRTNGWKALLATVLLLGAVAAIAAILDNPAVTELDRTVGEAIRSLRSEALDQAAKWLNIVGSTKGYAVITAVAAVWFALRKKAPEAILTIVSVAGAYGLNTLVKNIVERPRPPAAEALFMEDGFSFPSGNATIAAALIGYIMFAICLHSATRPALRMSTIAIGSIIMLLIGAFRIYAGVHYATDIVSGYLLGAAWLAIVVYIQRKYMT
ncbi:phosphatase PAP2 family protein [Paenibacillus thermotolerans]|uniref:phosphatase PAP2 family protein n=1 Tax=Paenibacillus thermotolerans TaxID=3027807 RepID=UPI002367AFF9|nr:MULTISPECIES: phosphatase PAP2 family protein [unclassified Paenibacillus]